MPHGRRTRPRRPPGSAWKQPNGPEDAARETAAAAEVLSATASEEQSLADTAVGEAAMAEIDAKDAFQEAQRQGFPKEPG